MSNASELAAFQRDAIERIRSEHRAARRTLLCLPTGTGKTRVAVNYAFEDFVRRDQPVLWVAHTEELLEQAYETFRSVGVPASSMARRFGRIDELKCAARPLVAFVSNAGQSGPDEVALVVVDEAHHAAGKSYTGWLSLYRAFARDGARVLGLTATPYRLDDGQVVHLTSFGFSRPRVPIFESVAYERSFCELIELERVAPFVREQVETHLSYFPRVKNGEVSPETLDELNTPRRNRIIVDAWNANRARWGKTIVFVGRTAHAKALARAFGPVAGFLSSENADERDDVLRRFRQGEVPVLVNVRMLGEGLDVPDVQTVIIARPTMSPMLYIQMVGRGSRVTPTKKFFYLVDVHDQLGEFERFLAGVEDLAERKPGLLEVNARRASLAQAENVASTSPPAAGRGRLDGSGPSPVFDSYSAILGALLERARAGQSFEPLFPGLYPAAWWEVPSAAVGLSSTLMVLSADRRAIDLRIQLAKQCLSERCPPPTVWPEPLQAMPEEVFARFVEVLVERGGVAVSWNADGWPGQLVFALEAAIAFTAGVKRPSVVVRGLTLERWLEAASLEGRAPSTAVVLPDEGLVVEQAFFDAARQAFEQARQRDPLAHPDLHLEAVVRRDFPDADAERRRLLRAVLSRSRSVLASAMGLNAEEVELLVQPLPELLRAEPRRVLSANFHADSVSRDA